MKQGKRCEEAEDHKDEYSKARNGKFNLGAEEFRNCQSNFINDQVKEVLGNYINQEQMGELGKMYDMIKKNVAQEFFKYLKSCHLKEAVNSFCSPKKATGRWN